MQPLRGDVIDARGLLFDMDGTLVDSVAAVERTWRGWAALHCLDPAPILAVAHGRRGIDTVHMFAPEGVDFEVEASRLAEVEREQTEGIRAVPGAGPLLRSLPPGSWAVVTSADRALAVSRLTLAGLPIPDLLITAEDVTAGKPDPQGYRLAARRLGLAAGDCIVFEDAPAGIAAGRASGARLVVVATTLPKAQLVDAAWIGDFSGVSVSLHAGRLRVHFT
ncbi:sugar-phosphatase [Constrictibacter sp. MBR-5]|jgi:sugar-phosphatase|uniref:HAD-IA family hydrolase n=1 Tax=Constrictibacter sp. MBR-5 TaxID=3156467 RepID=UPI003397BA6D